MISRTTPSFWERFYASPLYVQRQARIKFALFRLEPFHPSLQFKEVGPDIWSARVTLSYRVLGERNGDEIVWTWLGPHAEYDRILRNLKK